jgi:hypothetical protein
MDDPNYCVVTTASWFVLPADPPLLSGPTVNLDANARLTPAPTFARDSIE